MRSVNARERRKTLCSRSCAALSPRSRKRAASRPSGRRYIESSGNGWSFYLFVRTDTRADSLLAGALLASLWVRGVTPRRGVDRAAWVRANVSTFAALIGTIEGDLLDLGCLFADSAVHLIADVSGYFLGDGQPPAARYTPLPPRRIADTRTGAKLPSLLGSSGEKRYLKAICALLTAPP